MSRIPAWRRYLTFWRAPIAQDVDDELRFHTNMRVKEYMARGMLEDEARRAVAERLGDLASAKSECIELTESRERNARNAAFFDALRSDLRYAFRGLGKRPGVATAIVVTLGLGIGANAAVFSVVDRLLFRAAPMLRDASRTHRLYVSYPTPNLEGNFIMDELPYVRFATLSAGNRSFERTAAFSSDRFTIGGPADGRDMLVAGVTPSFFDFFDAQPVVGRYFNDRESAPPSGDAVVVLSYGTWQTEYGGLYGAVGSKLQIGERIYTVVGVASRGFVGLSPETPPGAFIPLSAYAAAFHPTAVGGFNWWNSYDFGATVKMLVTRKPGVTLEQVDDELTRDIRARWSDRVERGPPDLQPTAILASTLAERGPEQSSAAKVAALVGAMALVVLLIAAANVANLLLARAVSRRREIAVRLALGVSRGRLVLQLFIETLLLALLGGIVGLIAASWGGPALRATFLTPSADTAVLSDVRTLIVVGLAVLTAGALTGLFPAWQASRLDVAHFLRIGVRGGTLQRSRLRATLVVTQGALSVLLLIAAGLFVRSLRNARQLRLGYDVAPVLVANMDLRGVKFDSARTADLWTRLQNAARHVPGVEHAAVAEGLPFMCCGPVAHVERPSDMDSLRFFKLPDIHSNAVTPDYFATMGTRIIRGRAIDSTDVAGAPRVAVVSERLAQTLWPERSPIGQCLMLWELKTSAARPGERVPTRTKVRSCATIIGIAENIKSISLGDDPGLNFYLSYAQEKVRHSELAIHTQSGAAGYAQQVRAALQRVMPPSSYITVTPYSDVLGGQMRSWQLGAAMFVGFGALALLLAAVGFYSAISYSVAQRTHEMAVRRALGAQASNVLILVARQGLLLGGIGIVLGATIAFIAGRRIEPLLFGVSARDPFVYSAVVGGMLAVAAVASLVPARRAATVDPDLALRDE